MTIRFLKPWNGYQPDAVVSGLTNESALIAGGLASDDLDGGNDGRTYEAKLATDANGNAIGLVFPDGSVSGVGVGVELATGDPITDGASINAAIANAGAGGMIQFPPNQEYVTYGWHEILTGQRINLNGSTIKRADQKSSTVVTTVTSGLTQIVVSDASQFAVGMNVAVTVDDGVVDAYGSTANWTRSTRVTNVNTGTNTVTVSPAFAVVNSGGGYKALSQANGAKLATCGPLFRAGVTDGVAAAWASLPTDIVISGGKINGNKANNTLGRWWSLSPTFELAMHYGQVRDIYSYDAMSDEILHSGIANRFYKNSSLEASGNFSHPSSWDGTNGTVDAVVDGNYVYNCTRDTTIGHSDGALIFSNDNKGTVYSNNTVDGSNRWGCGSGFNVEDTQAAYVGNIVRNCLSGAFRVHGGTDFVFTGNVCVDNGQDVSAAAVQISVIEAGSARVSVTNNTFTNSPLLVRAGGGGDPDNLIISGNVFYGTAARTSNWKLAHLWLNAVGNATISGNSFTGGTASTSWDGILVSGAAKNANIVGNKFVNGRIGVRINTASFAGVAVKGNEFVDQYDTAIAQDVAGAYKQLTISDNDIKLSSGATIAGTWHGISVTSSATSGHEPALVQGNSVRSEKTSGTQRGIYLSGTQRATIVNNRVRTSHTSAPTIDASGAVAAAVILLDNECTNGTNSGIGANMSTATLVHSGSDTNRLLSVA